MLVKAGDTARFILLFKPSKISQIFNLLRSKKRLIKAGSSGLQNNKQMIFCKQEAAMNSFGQRLKSARLMAKLSMAELVQKVNGIVSAQGSITRFLRT